MNINYKYFMKEKERIRENLIKDYEHPIKFNERRIHVLNFLINYFEEMKIIPREIEWKDGECKIEKVHDLDSLLFDIEYVDLSIRLSIRYRTSDDWDFMPIKLRSNFPEDQDIPITKTLILEKMKEYRDDLKKDISVRENEDYKTKIDYYINTTEEFLKKLNDLNVNECLDDMFYDKLGDILGFVEK